MSIILTADKTWHWQWGVGLAATPGAPLPLTKGNLAQLGGYDRVAAATIAGLGQRTGRFRSRLLYRVRACKSLCSYEDRARSVGDEFDTLPKSAIVLAWRDIRPRDKTRAAAERILGALVYGNAVPFKAPATAKFDGDDGEFFGPDS